LFNLTHRGDIGADALFAEHCRFGAQFEVPSQAFANPREPERCLRIGIVSGDLYLHAVANFIEPVLMRLANSAQLSLHAYYNHVQEDEVTQRLKGHFAQWGSVFGLTDEELAQKIRADGIDILIDLSGHTARNRLPVFARKPAPLQASWMGYPGTTGLQAMDYYLGDRFWLPPGQFDHQFTEKIVRLPANAPFLPAGGAPDINALPALENGYVTLGSFNRPNKISQPVVALWSRLLQALPESRLLLGAMPKDGENDQLITWFAQEGIEQERLTLHPRSGMDVYLALHQQVDICLDTFPYNGGTTTCHAAWMGVPTLTLAGTTVTGRVGAMIAGHLGLDEFVAQDPDDFVRKGVYWAGHLTELAELRAGMRARFEQSALGRPELIAAGLEQALRTMWRRWCNGLPAESFEVEAGVSPAEVLRHAAAFYQAGRLAEAEELCLSILQTEPGHADANYNLGLMALQQGQAERALPYLQAAWEGAPGEGAYWLTLTECLLALARFEDALGLIEEAIRRGMDTPQAQQLRLLAQRGRNRAAPDRAVAEGMQALFEAGRYAEMEQQARSLLAQYPGWALGWKALGAALQSQDKDAESILRRAVEISPRDAEAHNNLGVYLRKHGRPSEAVASLQAAVQIQPTFAEAHFRLGGALADLREFDKALESFRCAAKLRDGYAEAYQSMGAVLNGLGRFDEAVASYRLALEIKPDYVDARVNMGSALLGQGKISEAKASYRQALELMPGSAELYSNYLFCLSHDDEGGAETIASEHRKFGERFETPLHEEWGGYANIPDPERRLHVGLVSADLFNHAVAGFIEPVLACLADHSNMVLHAYSNTSVEDEVTKRLKGYFAHWDGVAGMADEALARKIRADGIDILIDLSGHTAHNRLLTFARKPAPLQASWMGYPGTTGLQAMDYYFGDRFFLPTGQFDDQFMEKIVRLPANAPFLPAADAPTVNVLPALENGYLTFGSFNRPSKLSRPVIALWSRLLRALPDSRILLGAMSRDGTYGELLDWFAQEGIARERLSFHPRTGMDAYLALHQQVDICLDTFPYNGGTTTCHAAWMGVPTLTLAGETGAGRVGVMILGHLGLGEFAAHTPDDFAQKAVYWAGHLAELAELRAGMRARFEGSALGRPELIAAGLEQALRIMWRRWCAGLPAESFEVPGAGEG
ncbi:MAG TPA: tetratricopeptide repeat protein, partial [Gallionella sp.]|nr:tetratricopeptide repeat protein [Gallionella sp.]